MRTILKPARPVCLFLTILMVLTAMPYHHALAAMIGTETVLDGARGDAARRHVNSILAREDVQAVLAEQGIDPLEARARVASLTDSEIIYLADTIDRMPAGGDALGVIVGAALIVFIVLLITDIMGVTDVFPFVKKHRR